MAIETSLIKELEALRMGGDLFSDMTRELNDQLREVCEKFARKEASN